MLRHFVAMILTFVGGALFGGNVIALYVQIKISGSTMPNVMGIIGGVVFVLAISFFTLPKKENGS